MEPVSTNLLDRLRRNPGAISCLLFLGLVGWISASQVGTTAECEPRTWGGAALVLFWFAIAQGLGYWAGQESRSSSAVLPAWFHQ
jgi:hypothetical protein